jgi:hypothetical protein
MAFGHLWGISYKEQMDGNLIVAHLLGRAALSHRIEGAVVDSFRLSFRRQVEDLRAALQR